MAFIRRKKINGHYYYQAVRNYRDDAGKHRQELLCHLGKHKSLDAAITAEEAAAKMWRERLDSWVQRGDDLYEQIHDLYAMDVAEWGGIPSRADISARRLRYLHDRRDTYEYYLRTRGEKEYELELEAIDMQLEYYRLCFDFHEHFEALEKAEQRVDRHEKRLERYLQVKREYF